MSSNNLYGQLIEVIICQTQMAKQENITLSEISSARESQHKALDEFALKMSEVK